MIEKMTASIVKALTDQDKEISHGFTVESNQSIDYKLVNYIKYEFGSFADERKKLLEISLVEKIIAKLMNKSENILTSLDIGCATGRYPRWLASQGFYACGYDIEDAALDICREHSKYISNVHFEKRNILEDGVEPERFDLVTCMMGTFNHIIDEQRAFFLEKIRETLMTNGLFLFSSWNPECSYTNFLQFYTRNEREFLMSNSMSADKMIVFLEASGFEVTSVVHFGYLTDECYNNWGNNISDKSIIELDIELRQLLGKDNSQMYFVVARKK